jgi:RNA polymerase sigma factor (sigma-70 family)
LLRLQSDERLITLVRRGNHSAFEALVSRYQARLLAFCRHMLASREDAEDVLQEVFAAAFNAILADDRPINVRPWLYRIARNRSLNHLRRQTAVGVDSMDVHYAEAGLTTSEKVSQREDFRLLLADIDRLPETQRTALLLREMEALSYQQIAEVMDTTVPSVKSLLVRARVSLAEAAEGRRLTCEEVRLELGAIAEGLDKETPPIRRHVKDCERCHEFRAQLRSNNRALAAVLPVVPFLLLKSPLALVKSLMFKKLVLAKVGSTAGAGGATMSTATAGGASTAGAAGAAGSAGIFGAGGGAAGALSAGAGALATKAAAGLAAAAIVTAGAVEVRHSAPQHRRHVAAAVAPAVPDASEQAQTPQLLDKAGQQRTGGTPAAAVRHKGKPRVTAPPTTQLGASQPPTSPSTTPLQPTTQQGSSTTVLPSQPAGPQQGQQPPQSATTTPPPGDTTTTSSPPVGTAPSSAPPSTSTTTTPSSTSSPPSSTTTTPSPSSQPSSTTTTPSPSSPPSSTTTTPSPSSPPSSTTTTPSPSPTKQSAANSSPAHTGATTTTTPTSSSTPSNTTGTATYPAGALP